MKELKMVTKKKRLLTLLLVAAPVGMLCAKVPNGLVKAKSSLQPKAKAKSYEPYIQGRTRSFAETGYHTHVGLAYSLWGQGGWRDYNTNWWLDQPAWYRKNDWQYLSNEQRIREIENQTSILMEHKYNGNDSNELREQLNHLRTRHSDLAARG